MFGASIEYRLSGEAQFPAALEDAKCAVRWVRSVAGKYKIDPQRIAGRECRRREAELGIDPDQSGPRILDDGNGGTVAAAALHRLDVSRQPEETVRMGTVALRPRDQVRHDPCIDLRHAVGGEDFARQLVHVVECQMNGFSHAHSLVFNRSAVRHPTICK